MKWIFRQFIAAIIEAIKNFLDDKADNPGHRDKKEDIHTQEPEMPHTPVAYGVDLGPPLSTYQKRDKAAAEKWLNGL